MRLGHWVRVVALGLTPAPCVLGDEPLRLSRLGSDSGLSHNSVYAVIQDHQGFLWIGTVDGLNRYDGYSFTTLRHDPSDAASLPNPVVRSLLEDGEGRFWVGTHGGVARLNRAAGSFTRYALGSSAGEIRIVRTLREDRGGRVWAGTDQGLYRYHAVEDRFVPHALAAPPATEPAATAVVALDEDSSGALWALTSTSQGETPRLHRVTPSGPPQAAVGFSPHWAALFTFAIDRRDRFWFEPAGPTPVVRGREVPPPREAARPSVIASLQSRSGTLWMGTDAGLVRIDPATGKRQLHALGPKKGGWLQDFVRALVEDRTGTLWIGSYTGIHRHDPAAKPFRNWRHDPLDSASLSGSAVSALAQGRDGELWVGTFGFGLNRFDASRGTAQRHRHRPGDSRSLRGDVVWAIHGQPDGTLWIATEAGLCTLDPRSGRFRWRDLAVLPRAPISGSARITRIAAGAAGRLWLAGFTGLYSLDPATGATREYPLDPEGRMRAVESLLPTEAGVVWAGSGELGLLRIEAATGAVRRFPLQDAGGRLLQSEGIWTLRRDARGGLWLGSGVGLSRFDPERESFEHYHARDGLPGSVVYSLLDDDAGRLWLGTNRGLARFDPAAPRERRFRTYDASDGIAGAEFNRHAALRAGNGELFFGGIDGLTGFRPAEIRDDPQPPPVVLTAIQSASRAGSLSHEPFGLERLALTFRDSSFGFEFAALGFANPARNRYAYRLTGFDPAWVEAGARRFARYTNVPPGEYVFRVKGSNADGVWNEAGLALPVSIAPPFWQTWWFRILALAAASGLLIAAYRYRVERLLELERLRLRIASDLHDDISSDLSGIAVALDLLGRRPAVTPEHRGRLDELRDRALRMADSLRDTVWSVQPEHDSLESLARRLRSVAASLLPDTHVSFDLRVPPHTPLHMTVRRGVFLTCKELLHNVARHGRASNVEVTLATEDGRLRLRVSDDGVGFDPDASHEGEGLRSLRRRARQLGAELSIKSRPGAGTVATLDVAVARTRDGADPMARV